MEKNFSGVKNFNVIHSHNYSNEWYTPKYLVEAIQNHFNPSGIIEEPYPGPNGEGFGQKSDATHVDWIITNPPWSTLTQEMETCFQRADNVVFLVPAYKVFSSDKRYKLMEKYGNFKEMVYINSCNRIWKGSMGMPLFCIYWKRNYRGPCMWNKLKYEVLEKPVEGGKRKRQDETK